MVGIPTVVERVAEDVATQVDTATHQDACDLTELDVRCGDVTAGEAAAVADGDESLRPSRERQGRRHCLGESGESVIRRLLSQSALLPKTLGQHQRLISQKVEDVAEEDAVAVDEILAFSVLRWRRLSEQLCQCGLGVLGQRGQGRRVEHPSHVELDDGGQVHRHGRVLGHVSTLWLQDQYSDGCSGATAAPASHMFSFILRICLKRSFITFTLLPLLAT